MFTKSGHSALLFESYNEALLRCCAGNSEEKSLVAVRGKDENSISIVTSPVPASESIALWKTVVYISDG